MLRSGTYTIFALLVASLVPLILPQIARADETSDILRLITTLKSADAVSEKCVNGSCFEVSCKDATALHEALGDTIGYLAVLPQPLKDEADADLKRMQVIQQQADQLNIDDSKTRRNKRIFQNLLHIGKFFLALASISDNIQETLHEVTHGPSPALVDNLIETNSEMLSELDDLISAVGEISDPDSEVEGLRTKAQAKLMFLKSQLSDVARWLASTKAYYQKNDDEAGRQSLKHAGIVLARTLEDIAENGSEELGLAGPDVFDKELKAISDRAGELDAEWADAYKAYISHLDLLIRVRAALDLNRSVFDKHSACMRGCPKSTIKPYPYVAGMSSSQILAKYLPYVAKQESLIRSAVLAFSVKPGKAPTVAVDPKSVPEGASVTASYFVAECLATDGTQIEVRNTRSYATINLGNAKRGNVTKLQLQAETGPDDYDVRLFDPHDPHNPALASAEFHVLGPPAKPAKSPSGKLSAPPNNAGTSPPPKKNDCPKGGGLVGAMNNEACQIDNH